VTTLPIDLVEAVKKWALAMKQLQKDRVEDFQAILTQEGCPPEHVQALVPEKEE